MSEQFGNMNYGDFEVPLTVDNVAAFKHYGDESIYDHVFVIMPEQFDDGAEKRALYLFKHIGKTALVHDLILGGLEKQDDAEIHSNIRRPSIKDVEMFQRALWHGDEESLPFPEI